MRVFIAIDMPESVSAHLRTLQSQIKGARCTLPSHFHLTLRFLGDIDEQDLPGIKERLALVKFGAFDARVRGIGTFPGGARVSIIWAGLEPADLLGALQKSISRALVGIGAPEDFPFAPHITLARVKTAEDKSALFSSIRAMRAEPLTFRVDRFRLYESTLTPDGPAYKSLATFTAQNP